MTKEQEEAIGRLHGLLVTDFNYSGHTESGAYWQHSISFRKDHKYYADAIETVLSMLEEKDKEYEELTESSEALSKAVNLMKKVMNEMAKVICMLDTMNNYETWNNDIEEVKEYFYKKVEDKR